MALQFILGGSGSGKSYCLYRRIIEEASRHPKRRYLVLVPEQFTLQTQRDLVAMHPRHGILNIDVLSFQRLAYRVFEETGKEIGTVLEETGKNLMLRRVTQKERERLTVLGGNLKRMGAVSQMKSMISELTQYGITPERLTEVMEESRRSPQLYYKLQDMRLLYEEFHKSLEGRYITAEEILGALCQVIDKSETVRGSVVALDGFTGFTPVQNQVLGKLLLQAREVLVAVTLDDREKADGFFQEHELFYLSKKTIQSLKKMARDSHVPVAEDFVVHQGELSRFHRKGDLFRLEQNLFRQAGDPLRKEDREEEAQLTREAQTVRLLEARDPRMEVRQCAEEICRMVRKDYHFRQIAVVTGDLTVYSHYIEEIFPDYGIPVFLDYKRNVLENPMVEFLRAFLEIAEQDFTYESVFRYLRSGLAGMEPEDVDVLENYVLALGIRGHKKWEDRWLRLYGDLKEEEMEKINLLREEFWQKSGQAAARIRKKKMTVLERTREIYDLVTGLRLQEQLKGREEYFAAGKEAGLAREYRQIYGIIMDLFDKVAELLGEETMPLSEYREILDAGFGEAKVGVVPPGLDQVLAGDVERSRLKDIRALFFLGVNEGNVPRAVGTPGVLSDMDRERLKALGLELAPTPRQQAFTQRLYLYLNMTKPSERLYVSYSQVDVNGKGLRPSYLIGVLQKIFPGLSPWKAEEFLRAGGGPAFAGEKEKPLADACASTGNPDILPGEREPGKEASWLEQIDTPRQALEYLKRGLVGYREGENDPEFLELYRWFAARESQEGKLRQLLKGTFSRRRDSALGKAVARALYGTALENSVTRLEQFAACAYAHFLRYGLSLRERELYGFEPVDMGNVFHGVMELFFKRMQESGYTWGTLPEEVREEWADACLEQVITDYGNTVLQSTARNAYTIDRMRRIIRRSVWALGEQLKMGSFAPENYEVSFAQVSDLEAVNISLSQEECIRLRGRIDRMDVCEETERVLVKVIDYKSGSTSFKLLSLYHGLQLQLVVYLGAALELEQKLHPDKEAVPAGIFYYRMEDPMLELMEGETQEDRNRRILESLKLNGLVNREDGVIQKLDKSMPGKSSVLPLSYNKDGSLRAGSSVASREQFGQMMNYVNQKIKELGGRMLEGEISVNPYELDGKTACDYCVYKGVCQVEPKGKERGFRRLPQLSADELWEKMGKETSGTEDF